MRTAFGAVRTGSGAQHAEVLHQRIVPRDKLLGELASLARSDLIAKMPIDIHVTPTP